MTAVVAPIRVTEPGCPFCGAPVSWQVGVERSCEAHVGNVAALIYSAGVLAGPVVVAPLEVES